MLRKGEGKALISDSTTEKEWDIGVVCGAF